VACIEKLFGEKEVQKVYRFGAPLAEANMADSLVESL
jgi:hypothetical protein